MAVVNHTTSHLHRGYKILWEGLTAGGTGDGVKIESTPDMMISINGNIDGGSLGFEGSNNGSDWFELHGLDLVAVALTTVDTCVQILEAPDEVRPNLTGGGGSTDLDVYLVVRQGGR